MSALLRDIPFSWGLYSPWEAPHRRETLHMFRMQHELPLLQQFSPAYECQLGLFLKCAYKDTKLIILLINLSNRALVHRLTEMSAHGHVHFAPRVSREKASYWCICALILGKSLSVVIFVAGGSPKKMICWSTNRHIHLPSKLSSVVIAIGPSTLVKN